MWDLFTFNIQVPVCSVVIKPNSEEPPQASLLGGFKEISELLELNL